MSKYMYMYERDSEAKLVNIHMYTYMYNVLSIYMYLYINVHVYIIPCSLTMMGTVMLISCAAVMMPRAISSQRTIPPNMFTNTAFT